MSSGDVWIGQIWGADVYTIQERTPNVEFYIPEEGGVRGSDTMAIFSGAKHPIAAHLFINHMLDAQVSAENTNYIGYMGPNAAAKEFIEPAILDGPGGEPGPGGRRQAGRAARPRPADRDEVPHALADAPWRLSPRASTARAGSRARRLGAVAASLPGDRLAGLFFVVPLAIIFVVSLGSATRSTGSCSTS